MSGILVGDREMAQRAETLDVPTMRADLARILGEHLVREVVDHEGELVDASADLLAATEEIRTEQGAREQRAKWHLSYREMKFSEEGVLRAEFPARAKFEGLIRNMIAQVRERLLDEQPNCDWQLAAALVDAVPADGLAQRATGASNAPGSIDPSVAAHQAMMRGDRDGEGGEVRLGSRVLKTEPSRHWRWYVRMCWFDRSGSGEWVDPIEVRGGKPGPHAKYAATRIVRLLPPGARRNREEAIKLLRRVGAEALVAPAQQLTQEQQQAALVLLSAGMNPALVARNLGVQPSEVEALVEAKPKRAPRRKAEAEADEGAAPVV